jgi:hypothetical protein
MSSATMTDHEARAEALEAEVAGVCGVINAAAARLVGLIGEVVATGAWEGADVLSPAHWVGWKCGVSPRRARRLLFMARRLAELPHTRAAFAAGELSEDQVALICRHAPAEADAAVAEFARHATVSQLSRVLSTYVFEHERPRSEAERRVSFGPDDDGWWRCWARLGPEEGAVVEAAMAQERQRRKLGSWADAFVAMAERCLGADHAEGGHHDGATVPRPPTVVVHLHPDGSGHLHLGPGLPDEVLRHLGCDGRVRTVGHDARGVATSVGRALRIVPERTRLVIEERDRGCRVPGCDHRRWLQVHHVTHWLDGGPTDTTNLVCLCGHHHRLLHRGAFTIAGDADDPDGLVFTDRRGRPLAGCGPPTPPATPASSTGPNPITGAWTPPSGERLDWWMVTFDEVPIGA